MVSLGFAVPKPAPEPTPDNLLARLTQYFDVKTADTPDLLSQAHHIRYQVYCVETGFEDASAFPDRLEKDVYDSRAVHGLLVHRQSAQAVGTVRLVLPQLNDLKNSFAVQSVSDHPAFADSPALPLHSTGEVSRFCISRQFRRRPGDTQYDQTETRPVPARSTGDRRSGALMRLGLIQVLIRMSVNNGITHWCALMEPTLLRLLDAMAIRFTRHGPLYKSREQSVPLNRL